MTELINVIIIKATFRIENLILNRISTWRNLIIGNLKGIEFGENLKTLGRVHFHRSPKSTITIGNNCEFRSRQTSNLIGINRVCIISTHTSNAKIIIGDNCGFSGVTIGCADTIVIGANCLIGANVIITDTDWHSLKTDERRTGIPKAKATLIHDNVFIGVNSIILKGSSIGKNSIIGAGSVVSGEIPDNVIAAGNPCKVVKQLV